MDSIRCLRVCVSSNVGSNPHRLTFFFLIMYLDTVCTVFPFMVVQHSTVTVKWVKFSSAWVVEVDQLRETQTLKTDLIHSTYSTVHRSSVPNQYSTSTSTSLPYHSTSWPNHLQRSLRLIHLHLSILISFLMSINPPLRYLLLDPLNLIHLNLQSSISLTMPRNPANWRLTLLLP